jgi:hypothetical protein
MWRRPRASSRPAATILASSTPEEIDRLDFFVAELKKQGIYSDLNLNVSRTYKAGDGARDYELIGAAKGLTYGDRRGRR